MFDLGTILIDNNLDEGAHSYFYENPIGIISAYSKDEVKDAISQLENALKSNLYLAGYFSYELGYCFEEIFSKNIFQDNSNPLLWFGIYENRKILENSEVDLLLKLAAKGSDFNLSKPKYSNDYKEYSQKFEIIHNAIESGALYQANLTFDVEFDFSGSPIALYAALRNQQKSPCGSLINIGDALILSRSPEIFFQKQQRNICVIPMKGTMARSSEPQKDVANIETLKNDKKQRAENLMIVDLMRNDLSKISTKGSVKTDKLFEIQTFDSLHQMVSIINSTLKADVNIAEIIKAIFPCGSITGAPKISAMEHIVKLEDRPRGVYCGAIGHFEPNGDANFNVAIRTIIAKNKKVLMGIGSGLVYDSIAKNEYEECKLKASFLANAKPEFTLFETMLWQKGIGLSRIEKHIARLFNSAQSLGLSFNEAEFLDLINGFNPNQEAEFARVKIEVGKKITLSYSEYYPTDSDMKFSISPTIIDQANPWLFHKTNRRELYDIEWEVLCQKYGCDEIVYFNRNDELTEGSRTNIFAEFEDGEIYTPPIKCGLLPGVLRCELIEKGEVKERIIRRSDFTKVKQFYLGNSLRGLRKAIFKPL